MKTKKILGISLFTLGLLAFSFAPVNAATFKTGDEVDIDEIIDDDLFASGGTVDVNKKVEEDSIIFGGQVKIDAAIGQDLIIFGGQIEINKNIAGDLMVAGGQTTIKGNVGEDVIVAGGTVLLESGSTITGDMIVFSGDVKIKGDINGELKAYAGNILLDGNVKGPVEIKGSTVKINGTISGDAKISADDKIKMDDDAKIDGVLNYWQKTEDNSLFENNVTGKVIYDKDLKMSINLESRGPTIVGKITSAVVSLLRAALIIALLIWLFKKGFKRAAEYLREKPLNSLGYGALYLVAVPILAIILMIIVIGMPLGVLLVLFYVFGFVFFLTPLVAVVATRYVNQKYKKKWSNMMMFLVALGIAAAVKVLTMLPYLGTLVSLVVFVAGLGAIGATLAVVYSKVKNENKKA